MIILVNAEKSFHRIQYVFVTKGQKTFLSKLGKEQEFLSLCVSVLWEVDVKIGLDMQEVY